MDTVAFLDREYLDRSTAGQTIFVCSLDCHYDVGHPTVISNNLNNRPRQVDLVFTPAIKGDPISIGVMLSRVIDGYSGSDRSYTAHDRFPVVKSNYTPDQFRHR